MFESVMNRKLLGLLLILVIALSIHGSAFAQGPDGLEVTQSSLTVASEAHPSVYKVADAENGGRLVSVIVKLEDESLATYAGGVSGLAPTSPAATGLDQLNVQSSDSQAYLEYLQKKQDAFAGAALQQIPEGRVVHRYEAIFGGVSMIVPENEIDTLADMDGVVAVYRDEAQVIDTNNSPGFIGAPTIWNDLGGQESAGEGVIVGVLDTGVWPEHPSYSDPDPSGKPYAAPPNVPGANGFADGPRDPCDFGDAAVNADDAPFACNNKLIGAYDFLDTFKAVRGLIPGDFDSARDADGHGTHTSTTAAGNAGVEANILGADLGIVSGIAPRAHVVMYKVCGLIPENPFNSCFQSDSMAAAQQAILDGVDVINFSISGGGSPYTDPVSLAFLDAYASGVFVAASAGNSGPAPDTVAHRGPWTMTVAASTQDRSFVGKLHLLGANGDMLDLEGVSITGGYTGEVVLAEDFGDELCADPFPAGTFNGEIVVCERGVVARVAKSFNVAAGGAGGMVLYNPVLQSLVSDNHFVPSIHIQNDAGADLLAFMANAAHLPVTGTIVGGIATPSQGDVMAAFSSRGGPAQDLGISKPDITAPGVEILAGNTPMPALIVGGAPGQLFQAIAGTSMSSPHIAGSGALLKALHPDWTPGQIKSAIMTTSKTDDIFKEDGVTPADPFDYGSGRVDLHKAGNPGLTISESAAEFVALEERLWQANYPSVYLPIMPGRKTVTRTVHSELNTHSRWMTSVSSPPDVEITLPPIIDLPAGGSATFGITIDASTVPLGEVRHATVYLKLNPARSRVRSALVAHIPITLVRGQSSVAIEKTCDPASLAIGEETDCTITVTNNGFEDASVEVTDRMPEQLQLDMGSVTGATMVRRNGFMFEGSLFAAGPPGVNVVEDDLFGYVSLGDLGVPPFDCPSNCDDGGWILSGLDIDYLGQHYTQGIWSVNGTLELGTASGLATSFANQNLPDPTLPNNLLAPWWTDLNLSAGGNWYVATLTSGPTSWDVFEWEDVPRFGDPGSTFTFQIWLEQGSDNIHFAYGPFMGDTLDGTTGAEDDAGFAGDSYYFDGAGTLPWGGGTDLSVVAIPGVPGETHTIDFTAEALGGSRARWSTWTNCAELTSDVFYRTAIACFSGEIVP